MQNFEIVAQIAYLIMIAFSLVFTLGIIWRVEMRLDMAYKVFFCALVFLFLGGLANFFVETESFVVIKGTLDILFAAFLLVGIWLMRDLMRNIDGEKLDKE